jgi:hypothetical protein
MGSPAPIAVIRTTESEYVEAKFTASLRAGRKIDAAPQIDQQIDDKALKIKCLDTQTRTRPAGRRWPVLREAAGRVWVDISRRSPIKGVVKNALQFTI